ncbi:Uncharacterised protein [Mycobacteroides abscessus subsp. abscessus]|nr:Uncharacterised protein [Mycobacteroides abscessus subsp. abscessus]
MPIHHRAAVSGFPRNGFHRGRGVSACDEQAFGGIEQLLLRLLCGITAARRPAAATGSLVLALRLAGHPLAASSNNILTL